MSNTHSEHSWVRFGFRGGFQTPEKWECSRCKAQIEIIGSRVPVLSDLVMQKVHLDCDMMIATHIMES